MGGFFGAASLNDCINDVFFGTDYHSHLGTKRGGMTAYSPELGFQIQTLSPFFSAQSLAFMLYATSA